MDALMMKGREHVSIGHNALAGFGLYAAMSGWWFPQLFAWVPALFGGDILTRQIHHWAMWFFILFVVIPRHWVEGHDECPSTPG